MHSLMSFRHSIGFPSTAGLKLPRVSMAAGGPNASQVGRVGGQRKASSIAKSDGWWSRDKRPAANDPPIHPFMVETSDEEIQDLHARLDKARISPPLEDAGFHYGFNPEYLRKVISYWRHQFDWAKQVNVLNRYPHFKTKIEGLNVHFVHCKPFAAATGQLGKPLMLLHGWPGSFYEFYWMLPLLLTIQDDLAFEVICPSIPGYGYSDAPELEGFNTLDAARVFLKLMERLGYSEFYLQGGDWGSIIATNMAQMKPDCVKGLHLNMFPVSNANLVVLLSLLLGSHFPSLVGFSQEDVNRLYPYIQKNVFSMLRETGYLHIQATKPDTAGCGLNDSPVGLAAYILEKFSSWTDPQNVHLLDGGLERKFSLDDLLTIVMIYWTMGSIVPSMRFYKENFKEGLWKREDARTSVYVPTGLAAFPEDLLHCPPLWARQKYKNIMSYSYMPRGGHFAALEEPQLLADDIRQFVAKVEALKK
ncbi:epoxide hydrolase 1-like isoform X1 [Pygocentrus nattereri]|uniref:Epoxide hydrolase n=1 Tax=Pygocentrus nattereri TaxID=42514 RepID=A0A3B4EK14_PYGNA|nr:epoxide hydrolase 1-like isoform X1 [Pygocentrus nattereri]